MVTIHGNTELLLFAEILTGCVQKEVVPKEDNMLIISKNIKHNPGKEEAQSSVC